MLPEKEDQDTWKTACKVLAWAKCNCTLFQLRTHLPQHVLCKLVLIWFESLPLCYLEAHTEAFRLHSDGKQSPTRTDSVDDFSLNQGSPCI